MISIKTNEEIKKLKECGHILSKMYAHIEKYIQPGIITKELDIIAEDFLLKHNTIPVQKGYNGFPSTLCISVNEEVIHGIPGKRTLKDGDIVSLDCTISFGGMLTDSAKSYPVGIIDSSLSELLKHTKNALYEGIKISKHNMRINDVGKSIEKYLSPYEYGIVEDFCGHGIGKEIHEEPSIPNYYSRLNGRRLKENMVITIEPMITIGSGVVNTLEDGWTVVTEDKSYAAHFEM